MELSQSQQKEIDLNSVLAQLTPVGEPFDVDLAGRLSKAWQEIEEVHSDRKQIRKDIARLEEAASDDDAKHQALKQLRIIIGSPLLTLNPSQPLRSGRHGDCSSMLQDCLRQLTPLAQTIDKKLREESWFKRSDDGKKASNDDSKSNSLNARAVVGAGAVGMAAAGMAAAFTPDGAVGPSIALGAAAAGATAAFATESMSSEATKSKAKKKKKSDGNCEKDKVKVKVDGGQVEDDEEAKVQSEDYDDEEDYYWLVEDLPMAGFWVEAKKIFSRLCQCVVKFFHATWALLCWITETLVIRPIEWVWQTLSATARAVASAAQTAATTAEALGKSMLTSLDQVIDELMAYFFLHIFA